MEYVRYGDQETILGLIASLHLTSNYSDLTIICKDETLSAHKLVEADNSIRLTDKDPVLIEKVLQFLYTGNYTTPSPTRSSDSKQAGDGDIPKKDARPTEESESLLKQPPDNEPNAEVEVPPLEPFTETATRTMENTPEALVSELQTNVDPTSTDGEEGDKEDPTEPIELSLTDCHPSYFHARMYAEADYFMIDDLRRNARMRLCASLVNSPEKEAFADAIEEVYSTRANYQGLR
ncbi:hypothetical protein N7535_002468 [Penicillium sp. DV-2018c]|nr:hypothetical protein N7461_001849 [Penicillium sp. DV-2018c]KAJ5575542.1 hypothetical protein N7535_002468 [Penicillium sp. DV-2018c]